MNVEIRKPQVKFTAETAAKVVSWLISLAIAAAVLVPLGFLILRLPILAKAIIFALVGFGLGFLVLNRVQRRIEAALVKAWVKG